MTRHRGKHRKRRPVWRRLLQASALGAAVATVAAALWAPKHGDTAADVGEHPAAVSPSSDGAIQPAVSALALPNLAEAAAAAATAATPPPTTRRPTPTTTAPKTTRRTPAPAPVLAACSSTGWGVKPHVARAGHAIAKAFGLRDSLIGGFRSSSAVAGSDHPKGLALDFTAAGAFGDRIAAYAVEHRAELGVTYVIWRQRINYGTGWQGMEDRGGVTANHFDHVHVSFTAAPAGSPTC